MIFIYLIALVATLLFYILYEGMISFMIFIFTLALPFIFMLLNLIARRSLTARLEIGANSSAAGQNVPMTIWITNRSFVPVPAADIIIGYRVSTGGTEEKLTVSTPVFPYNSQKLTAGFTSKHYGMVECRIVSVRLFDMLRLSRFKLPKRNISPSVPELMVLPEAIPLTNAVASYSGLGLESDEYSQDKPGDDPSEIFSLHEYSEGDKLSRIHWKLTAKSDTLMVKDYSLPLADCCMIIADLYVAKNRPRSEELFDSVLQLSFSISTMLQSYGLRHRTASYSERTGMLEQTPVFDEQSLLEGAVQQLSCGICRTPNAAAFALTEEENGAMRFGHLIYVCSELSQAAAEQLSFSGLAHRYTVLLCSREGESLPLPNTEIEIVPVDCADIARSVADLVI